VPADVVACAKAGLWGYVPNSASMKDLVIAAQRVARGDTVCSAAMADGLFRHLRGGIASSADTELTQRQRQIVRLIGEGLSNKQIAGRLSLGTSTVKNHVHDILGRLQVTCRTEAAARLRHISHIS
jgi:DNA-binding NarL/FixJ family response regulator